ncbi:MAG: hypothetical protein ABJP33_12130 [Pseudoruegeria sp.]
MNLTFVPATASINKGSFSSLAATRPNGCFGFIRKDREKVDPVSFATHLPTLFEFVQNEKPSFQPM